MTDLNTVSIQSAINEADLTTPGTTQKYPLGKEIVIETPTVVKKFKYIRSDRTLTKGYVYTITTTPSAISTYAYRCTDPLGTASVFTEIGIPQAEIASAYYGFVQTAGPCSAFASAVATTGYAAIASTAFSILAVGTASTLIGPAVGSWTETTTTSGLAGLFLYGRLCQPIY